MKVLLFNPPGPEGKGFTREGRCTQEAGVWKTHWPPVSLASAAAMLEADGHEARVIDFPAAGLGIADLIEFVGKERPGLAAWSTGTPSLTFDLGMARLIKRESPETLTAVMGTHVTVLPDDALREPALDIVVRAEPERIIRNLCSAGHGWQGVKGISYIGTGGRAVHNPSEDFLKPDEIPFPAWNSLAPASYRLPLKGRPFLIVAPTRGCPYRCSFCTAPIYYGSKIRERPVEQVLDEIESNAARCGISEIFIWADTFTARKDYVMRFCRAIRERSLKISWTCNSRVDTVDREMLDAMRMAGCWMISFGIESGDDRILETAGKHITADQSRRAVRLAGAAGIRTAGHFIFGLEGETEETLLKTLAFALELPLDIAQFYAAAPFPGTRLYEEALRNGWLRRAEKHSGSFSQVSAAMNLPGLPGERVDAFIREAYRRFYLRPRVLFNLFTMLELGVIRRVPSALRRFAG